MILTYLVNFGFVVGIVNYKITANGSTANKDYSNKFYVNVKLYNKINEMVASGNSNEDLTGAIEVTNVRPWWPYLMHDEPGYLYQMEISLYDSKDFLHDVYRLKIGFRTLSWNEKEFKINDKPVYFRGFGRHEDSDVTFL